MSTSLCKISVSRRVYFFNLVFICFLQKKISIFKRAILSININIYYLPPPLDDSEYGELETAEDLTAFSNLPKLFLILFISFIIIAPKNYCTKKLLSYLCQK